jgi:hypothetical protein
MAAARLKFLSLFLLNILMASFLKIVLPLSLLLQYCGVFVPHNVRILDLRRLKSHTSIENISNSTHGDV